MGKPPTEVLFLPNRRLPRVAHDIIWKIEWHFESSIGHPCTLNSSIAESAARLRWWSGEGSADPEEPIGSLEVCGWFLGVRRASFFFPCGFPSLYAPNPTSGRVGDKVATYIFILQFKFLVNLNSHLMARRRSFSLKHNEDPSR